MNHKPLDRELLRDLGFVLGTDWDHEVWHRDGMFWVHYGECQIASVMRSREVDGRTASRKEFLDELLRAVETEVEERARITFY